MLQICFRLYYFLNSRVMKRGKIARSTRCKYKMQMVERIIYMCITAAQYVKTLIINPHISLPQCVMVGVFV